MTNNDKIYNWLNKVPTFRTINNVVYDQHTKPFLDYEKLNAAAIELLPVLVERGFSPTLDYDGGGWVFEMWKPVEQDGNCRYGLLSERHAPTISEAITSAICQLIDKEGA